MKELCRKGTDKHGMIEIDSESPLQKGKADLSEAMVTWLQIFYRCQKDFCYGDRQNSILVRKYCLHFIILTKSPPPFF